MARMLHFLGFRRALGPLERMARVGAHTQGASDELG